MLAGAAREHRAALGVASLVVGGAVDGDDDLRAGEPLHRRGAGVVPDVLADVDAGLHPVDLEDGALVAAREVALLVEHAVVRQEDLAVNGGDAAVMEDGCAVVDAAFHLVWVEGCTEVERLAVHEVGNPDHDSDAVGCLGDALQLGAGVEEELALEEQVFRGVAGEGEFREGYEVGLALTGLLDEREYAFGVAVEVADGCVHLAEGYADGPHESPQCVVR